MIKAVDKYAVITDIRVLEKSGGKSGDWSVREDSSARAAHHRHLIDTEKGKPMSSEDFTMPENLTGLVIVASTRAARGVYEDKSGPIAVEWLRSHGFDTPMPWSLKTAILSSTSTPW